MTIKEYQEHALLTDQVPDVSKSQQAIIIPLLGLAGEAGTLLTEYKKRLREGAAYQIFKDRIAEELGDILWYVSNIATKANLDLEEIANLNLQKVRNQWLPPENGRGRKPRLLDDSYPAREQFPRTFRIHIEEVKLKGNIKVAMEMDGSALGDPLTDNAYEEDGYRYHDIFHLAYAAILGWSPVTRKLMGRKRKSNLKTDEVEDGGRATAIEEGISALVFDYAKDHSFLEGVADISYTVLRTIKQLTRHLEVAKCSEYEWQNAILQGFSVWRQFRLYQRGIVVGNLRNKTVEFELLRTETARSAKSSGGLHHFAQ